MYSLAIIGRQTMLSLKLNFRNRMAVIYGYLFPLLFTIAFWAIWRADEVPLALHLGQLLTVTVLGGACFGLPTTLVSERERGVWRRYRLAPVPVWTFLASLLAARYVLLMTAALLQLALAFALGMPTPLHPGVLLLAFSVACLGFIGFGLVIAMLADTVPAVQALGQCIFLPMLMIGGVAVPLSSLPDWARHVSHFFPGRYAVEAMQAAVTGRGLAGTGFDLLALLLTGVAGGVAVASIFRWDVGERFTARRGKAWLALAFGMWLLVGVAAEILERVQGPIAASGAPPPRPIIHRPGRHVPASWHDVTAADIADVAFDRLPPDSGIIAPIAPDDEDPDPLIAAQLGKVRAALPGWAPLKVADPVQRVRNWLAILAVPDVLQMEQLERFLPLIVFAHLRAETPQGDLPGILYWIALHPNDGDDTAMRHLSALGLPDAAGPTDKPRGRVMLYAFKLLGRVTNRITPSQAGADAGSH